MIEQIKKKSFWLTGGAMFLFFFLSVVYIALSMLQDQLHSVSDLTEDLTDLGFGEVASALDRCNRGGNGYESVITFDGCKREALNTKQGVTYRSDIERLFLKYNL